MSTRMKVIVGTVAAMLLGAVVLLTVNQSQHRYEVCVTFNGHRYCALAAGRTPEEATQAAHAVACTMLTSNREENMVCMQMQPTSIRRLSGN